MLEGSFPTQPSLQGLIQRMSHELNAKAVLLFNDHGQILGRSGWLEDAHFPAMAALAAAMISAGRTLGELGDNPEESPTRFSCDSGSTGLYTVSVGAGRWLTTLYDQPLNPGQMRMRIRKYAETFAQIEEESTLRAFESDENRQLFGATLSPVEPEISTPLGKLTEKDSTLFGNITDDEIDRLFENPLVEKRP